MTDDADFGQPPSNSLGGIMPAKGDARRTAALVEFIDRRKHDLRIDSDMAVIRRGGGHKDGIRDIRRGSVPGTDKLAIIARGLAVPPSVLHNLIPPREREREPPQKPSRPKDDQAVIRDAEYIDQTRSLPVEVPALDLPLRRQRGPGLNDVIVSMVARPGALAGRSDAYSLYIPDDANAPMVREGHIAYVDPSRPTVLDHWVRVYPRDSAPYLAVLMDRTAETVTVRVLSEPSPRIIPSDHINKMERVVAFMMLDV